MKRKAYNKMKKMRTMKNIRKLVMLLAGMMVGGGVAWGQTDYSGVYYLSGNNQGADSYNVNNTTTNYYLCPTENWIFYQATNNITTTDNGQPFLTTYQYRNGTNDSTEAVWIIIKHPSQNYYYIIHAKDGKYMTTNGGISGSNSTNRIRVHLEETNSPNDNMLFNITNPSYYNISPQNNSGWYLNITQGNQPSLQGTNSAKNDGPEYTLDGITTRYVGGTIGLWNNASDYTSKWYLEDAKVTLTPTISNINPENNTFTITSAFVPTGCSIVYTTNDSDPSTSNGTPYTGAVSVTESMTVKAAVVGYGMVLSNIASKSLTPVIATPVVTNSHDGNISLSSATTGATIRYTTDGTTPSCNSGTTYLSAFALGDATVIKAIACLGSESSELTTYNVPQYTAPIISFNSSTSQVTISGLTGATIYYTTDGTVPSAGNYSGTGTTTVTINNISSATTIKAIATSLGYHPSTVAELAINQVATPSIQDNGSNAVSITCATDGATIYYTTDGSTPTTSSTEYTGPLTDGVSGVTIKAIAVKENMIPSAVGSGSVTLQCATPVITRVDMTFTLSCSMPTDATLHYTIDDGSETVYSGAVAFTSEQLPITVTAWATHNDYTTSAIASREISSGDGSPSAPYQIYSTTDLAKFVTDVNNGTTSSACYKLMADLSASGIGEITTTFSGTFEAAIDPATHMPYRITNLSAPLFTTLTGTVRNLVIESVAITSGDASGNTGAIACTANGTARIYNVGILAGSVGGSNYVGGLVGLLDGEARVINCYSYADITQGDYIGGIVGYNNVATDSRAAYLKTMVMNCMFYGGIDTNNCPHRAPIYNGTEISNKDANGVSNFNYFRLEAPYVQPTGVTYNCALGAEDRFLKRFEFYRHLLNGHRELAGWWATDTYSGSDMLKWVLLPDSIVSDHPYPVLMQQGKYPSVVNLDAANAQVGKPRNQGGKLGELAVHVQMGSGGAVYGAPDGATITTSDTTLIITDKDTAHYNFNYYKVQLPYYNDVGTKNYNSNRVVTGWKIVSITGGTPGTFTASDSWGGYNFADRHCTNKDLFSVSGRIFNQGAYWDVPEGVTAITIEPYWAKCVYLADPNADKVYSADMATGYNVSNVGGGQIYTNGSSYSIAGENQVVYTSIGNAIESTALFAGYTDQQRNSQSVYDYAVVLVGNYHHYYVKAAMEASKSKPYTITSIDLDGDNEPDYSYILRFDDRAECHPLRVDFINIPGLGMAQKSTDGTGSYNFGILIPKGWYESTNTSLLRFTQFEYEHKDRSATDALILQGGVMEQWVSNNQKGTSDKIPYIHVGSNVWFKEFHTGCHQDKQIATKHSPISVTGGDYDEFYLTGLYRGDVANKEDNAECYINGGRFGIVCGAAMEGIGKANGADNTGDISWLIQNADIHEFYAGGLNAAKPVTGNLSTTIVDSHVDLFCGGPKFGDMSANKTVVTNATGCTFGTFFGAGYGGNSYSRYAPSNQNNVSNINWNNWVSGQYTRAYNATYGGVSTRFLYQFLPMSDNKTNVARILIDFVKFSLATTHEVTSSLKHCSITDNFYGGGSLGKVDGTVTSTLDSCTVNGNVYGAGFSASLPTVEVDSIGFRTEPYYYEALGTYRTGVKGQTTTYTWEHGNAISVDNTNHILYTTEDLTTLGTVTGNASLTITGNSRIGTVENDPLTGHVFGGGEESKVQGDTHVILSGDAEVFGNVFGGGNKGIVGGNTSVKLQ